MRNDKQWVDNDGQRQVLDPSLTVPRPIEEYDEDMGDVLWWKFPIEEAPYVGSPNNLGFEVMVQMEASMHGFNGQIGRETSNSFSRMVGGWPGYHTHFTPIPMPEAPDATTTPRAT